MRLFDTLTRLFQRPRFGALTLFATNVCDARCPGCFQGDGLNRPENSLTLAEYEQIGARTPPLDGLLLSGGEPTLAPQLAEIVGAFIQQPGQAIALPTNGLNTERVVTQVTTLLERFPANRLIVGVSIDGPEALNDRLRGRSGAWRAALETLRQLDGLRPQAPHLRLTTLTTVMDRNQDVVPDLLRTLRDMGHCDYLTVEAYRPLREGCDLQRPDIDRLSAIQDLSNALSLEMLRERAPTEAAEMLSHIRAVHRSQRCVLRSGNLPFPCRAGQVSAVLESDGRFGLCELLAPVGNIRDFDYDIPRALASPAAQQQRAFIRTGQCACTHCVSLGQSVSFWPMAEIRRRLDKRAISRQLGASAPDGKTTEHSI